jgi:DNA-binding beta-propeller fold protein YncE
VQAGTVVRIRTAQTDTTMPSVTNMLVIGSGFAEKTDPSALVIGPTGVALAPGGLLYVADTLNNRIVSITNAVNRTTDANTGQVFSVLPTLNAPLGMAVRANHAELMVVNGGNGRLIGINEDGSQKSAGFISGSGTPPGAGTLFGLATSSSGLYFVNDGTNTLNLLSNPL